MGVAHVDGWELLERDREAGLLEDAVEAAAGGDGRLVVVEGEAGIGKTALLSHATRVAAARGLAVLRARGGELERDMTFGVARQLLEARVAHAAPDEQRALLRGAAAAARGLLGRDGDAGEPDEPTLVHGLYWVCANVAETRPLCIVVDDAQWSDAASLRWLVYLARRLDELAATVLIGVRLGEPDSPTELLDALRLLPHAVRLNPPALSPDATVALVRTTYGPEADAEFCRAVQDAAGGNPFLTREIVATLVAEGVPASAAEAGRVSALQPQAVSASVLLRLGRLPGAAVALARAVAVLGSGASLARAAALADLDPEEAAGAADSLTAAHVLKPTRPLEFLHPVIRTVLYQDIPAGERSRVHARAARVLRDEGAPAEDVVLHLLSTEPAGDPLVVEALRAVASRDPDPRRAVTLLQRAIAEPPPPAQRGEVLSELGEREARAFDPRAIDHLTEARALSSDRAEWLNVTRALARAWTLHDRPDEALRWARDELERLPAESGDPEERDLRLALRALEVIRGPVEPAQVAELRAEAAAAATAAERYVLAALAYKAIDWGTAADARELAEAALHGGLLEEGVRGSGFVLATFAVQSADAQVRSLEVTGAALEDTRARGDLSGYALALALQADASLHRGLVDAAAADARESLMLAEEHGLAWAVPTAIAILLETAAEQGRFEDAERLLARVHLTDWQMESARAAPYLHARGLLRLSQARPPQALEDLCAAGELAERYEIDHPTMLPWRSSAARAQLLLGKPGEAAELVRAELELARRFGAPYAIGPALRVLGLIEGGERGLELLREAVEVLESSEALLQRARALIDHGAALRRTNERAAAREPLRLGLDLAHQCGATLLAERAVQELEATGARPRRRVLSGVEALTPSEHRVAEMAARGLSNRDIAQELFLSVRTIENQLRQVYLKLDVAGRRELPAALGG